MSKKKPDLKLAPKPEDLNIPPEVQAIIRGAQKSLEGIQAAIADLTSQAKGITGHTNAMVADALGITPENGGSFDVATMTYRKGSA